MRSPKKGRRPRLTLADLAPQQQITCFWCRQPKPAQGSRPFRAHHVCADCVQALDTGATGASTAPPKPTKFSRESSEAKILRQNQPC